MENIAIIITKLNGGGAERCASNLSIELSNYYNVFLIVFDGNNITYPYKGTLIDLIIPDSSNSVRKVVNVLKRVKAVKKIKKRYNISCSISLLDGPNIVNTMSRVNDKIFVSVRNMLSKETVGKLRHKLIVHASMKSDLTVSLSKMVEKDLIEAFGVPKNKIKTIYNHCDSELLHSLIKDMPKPGFIKDGQVYFVTIGRLNRQKGQWHLIRSFKEVIKEVPNANLVIIGTGELEEKLKELADNLGVLDHIIFTGYIKNPHNVLKYSEAFIFPSLFEGLGNVLLEALAFRIPIISCDCVAGPREILAPGTSLEITTRNMELAEYGVLVPVLDDGHISAEDDLTEEEKELSKAILFLHNNPDLRTEYRMKAAKRLENFSINNIIDQWRRCIEESLER